MIEEYKVIFEFKDKPLSGWSVSDKVPLKIAKYWETQIKETGYDPELVKIIEEE